MSKERIDDIKEAYEMNKYDEIFGLGTRDINWLIDRAERYDEAVQDAIKLHDENKRYRKALNNILSVKKDKEFNRYAYMKLEIFEWAEEALKEESE